MRIRNNFVEISVQSCVESHPTLLLFRAVPDFTGGRCCAVEDHVNSVHTVTKANGDENEQELDCKQSNAKREQDCKDKVVMDVGENAHKVP